jgi:pyridoxine kinase
VTTEKIGGSFSGTGDIFASILSAKLVNSSDIKSAVETACDFITKSIKETISDTNGNFNTADGIHFEKYLCTLGEQK